MQRIMPAYEVERLEGKGQKTIFRYEIVYLRDENDEIVMDENGRKVIQTKQRTEKVVECDAGWMIYFPRGHSLHITDPREMERLGFFERPERVNLDSESEDDGIAQDEPLSLKQRSERATAGNRGNRRRASATASKDAGVSET